MSGLLDLIRPDLRGFPGYASARRVQSSGSVWLNANESALASPVDAGYALHRYPEPQPKLLRERLATLYGVDCAKLMVTRGSDEGIDLLVRAFCRPGKDAVLVAPPCFGMYAVCARVQGAPLVEVPLCQDGDAWSLDVDGVLNAIATREVRLVFLCSPANPTGQALTLSGIGALAEAIAGRAVLVIDEAYAEYSSKGSACALVESVPGLVVLRTLSKAHALAGARVGALIADPAVITVLRNLSAPYPIAAPSAALATAALSPEALAESRRRCHDVIAAREGLREKLTTLACVRTVYPSEGNFLLARFNDVGTVFDRLLAAGVVVRDMRAYPELRDALRITVGTAEENRELLAALVDRAVA